MNEIQIEKEWVGIADKILNNHKLVIIIGASDTGKSTFINFLCSFLDKKGKKVAIVDSDVGQQDIGIPETIALGIFTNNGIERHSWYFVGSVEPASKIPDMLIGTKKMVDKAREVADIILINTTGLVYGEVGRILKQSKIDIIDVDCIILFERRQELTHIISKYEVSDRIRIFKLNPSHNVSIKTREERRKKREDKIEQYFMKAKKIILSYEDKKLLNTFINNGRSLNKHELRLLTSYLHTPVYYGEVTSQGVFIVTDKSGSFPSLLKIKQYFKNDNLHLVDKDSFKNKLVGLINSSFELIDVGRITNINFDNKIIEILSPIENVDEVKIIKF